MHFFSAKMGSRESFAMSIPGLSLAPKENSVEIPRRCRPAFTRLLAEVIIYTKKMRCLMVFAQALSCHVPSCAMLSISIHAHNAQPEQLLSRCCPVRKLLQPNKKTAPLGSPTCHAAVTACHGAPALKFQPPQEIHGETFGTEMGKEWQRMNRIPVKGHKMNPEH